MRRLEARRDAGVVERAGFENQCTRKGTQGSNPCPSAANARSATDQLIELRSQKERWQSGRMRTLGKRVIVKAIPGFESLSLRQIAGPDHSGSVFFWLSRP